MSKGEALALNWRVPLANPASVVKGGLDEGESSRRTSVIGRQVCMFSSRVLTDLSLEVKGEANIAGRPRIGP